MSLAATLMYGTRLQALVGDDAALDQQAAELVVLTSEQAYSYWSAQGTIYRGWTKVRSGEVTDAISLLRSGSAEYCAAGMGMARPYQIALPHPVGRRLADRRKAR